MSRFALLSGAQRQARQITQDHTLVNEQRKMGLISADEIASSDSRHVLIRSVGPEMFVSPDTMAVTLQPGDVLILCTDGLHDELREPRSPPLLRRRRMPPRCRELVARAVEVDAATTHRAGHSRALGGAGWHVPRAAIPAADLKGWEQGSEGAREREDWEQGPRTVKVLMCDAGLGTSRS